MAGSISSSVYPATIAIKTLVESPAKTKSDLNAISKIYLAWQNKLDRENQGSAQNNLRRVKEDLQTLTSTTTDEALRSDKELLRRQTMFANELMGNFASVSKEGQSLFSIVAGGSPAEFQKMGVPAGISQQLGAPLRAGGEFDREQPGKERARVREQSRRYQQLDLEQQERVRKGIEFQMAAMVSRRKEIERAIELNKLAARAAEEVGVKRREAAKTVLPALDKEIAALKGEADVLIMSGKEWGDVSEKLQDVTKKRDDYAKSTKDSLDAIEKAKTLAEETVVELIEEDTALQTLHTNAKEYHNFIKMADKDTKEGLKERETRIKTLTTAVKEWARTVAKNIKDNEEWARGLSRGMSNAFSNFRSVLMETSVTLTMFYYKINQITDSLISFQQELMNAQSIFQTTSETLFSLSDEIVNFGTEFGIAYDNAAKGLYQFASAGLSAEDSLKVLNNTLKLSMAVQGDHNTLAKLTTQTIYGFGLSMDDSGEVTDKFAHAINKSLIEWQDLASSVKFALPFFVSANQGLEQLLGSLEILTNRALEAGIAGRGLRQALAEFTQHAKDNTAAFHKLGVEILDTDGNMRDLTDIAKQFNNALGEDANSMDIMIALMDDLNIRGATAFIHLAQNADEFKAAVDDLQNSAGAAHDMAMIQQEGLTMQIQKLKNLFLMPFILSENVSTDVGELNRLTIAVKMVVDSLSDLIVEGEGADAVLTETGEYLRNVIIEAVIQFGQVLSEVRDVAKEWSEAGYFNIKLLKLYFLPLKIVIKLLDVVDGSMGRVIIAIYILNKTLHLGKLAMLGYWVVMKFVNKEFVIGRMFVKGYTADIWALKISAEATAIPLKSMAMSVASFTLGMWAGYKLGKWLADAWSPLAAIFIGVAIAIAMVVAALTMGASVWTTKTGWVTLAAAGLGVGMTVAGLMAYTAPSPSSQSFPELDAYMAQIDSPGGVGAGAGASTSPQNLYVKKLVYTDSNEAEYMQVSAQTQAGA